jgi:hypothetical protein
MPRRWHEDSAPLGQPRWGRALYLFSVTSQSSSSSSSSAVFQVVYERNSRRLLMRSSLFHPGKPPRSGGGGEIEDDGEDDGKTTLNTYRALRARGWKPMLHYAVACRSGFPWISREDVLQTSLDALESNVAEHRIPACVRLLLGRAAIAQCVGGDASGQGNAGSPDSGGASPYPELRPLPAPGLPASTIPFTASRPSKQRAPSREDD